MRPPRWIQSSSAWSLTAPTTFDTIMEIIDGSSADKYDEGGDIRLVVLRLENPTLIPPDYPHRRTPDLFSEFGRKRFDPHVKRKRRLEG